MHYAIYDLKDGHILHIHSRVDADGNYKELSEDEVLSTVKPALDKTEVGVIAIEMPRRQGYDIHPGGAGAAGMRTATPSTQAGSIKGQSGHRPAK